MLSRFVYVTGWTCTATLVVTPLYNYLVSKNTTVNDIFRLVCLLFSDIFLASSKLVSNQHSQVFLLSTTAFQLPFRFCYGSDRIRRPLLANAGTPTCVAGNYYSLKVYMEDAWPQ